MSNEVKKTLRDLYLKEGSDLFSNSLKLNSYINDMLYAYRVEKNVLSTVVRGGYVSKILSEVKTEKDFSKAQFYVDQIVSQYGISKENASDAVGTIIYAIHGKEPNMPAKSKGTVSGGSGSLIGGSTTGTSGKIDIPTPIKVPPNNILTGGSSTSNQKKKIWPWIIVVIIGIIIVSNVVGNNSSNYSGDSTNTSTDTVPYVTTMNLTDLTYIYKDKNIIVGNSTVTTNAGTQCSNFIETECPYAEITYPLNGNFDELTATWALSEYGKNTKYKHSVEIFADGISVYKSPNITAGDVPININVNLNYCNSMTIIFSGVNNHAFLGDIKLSSSETDRVYNDNILSDVGSYVWIANMKDMGNEKMIVWKDTWVNTNTGTYLVNPINPYVPSYSNVEADEFSKNGSFIDYYFGKEYTKISGTCAINEKNKTVRGNMTIQLVADDIVIYTSPVMSKDSCPVDFSIDISGCEKLRIKFIPSGNGNWGYDAAGFNIGNLKVYK